MLFRRLAETLPSLCWLADPGGWIFWYNQRWYTYTGTTLEQMQGWGWQSVHDPEVLDSVVEQWKASIASGEPFDMVFPIRGADGVFRPFLTRVAPEKDKGGQILGWIGMNTEVAELRRQIDAAEGTSRQLATELGDLKRLFDTLQQAPSFVIVTKGPEHRVEFVNEAHRRLFNSDAWLGRSLRDAFPDIEGQGFFELLDRVYATGERHVGHAAPARFRRTPTDAEEAHYLDFIYAPVRDTEGEVCGIFCEGYEITERVRYAERLEAALTEKGSLARRNELLAQEMSHRIMNSLQIVEGALRMEMRRVVDPAAREVLERVGVRTQAMALVQRLLFQLSRDDTERIDVSDYVRKLAAELKRAFAESWTLEIDVEDGLVLPTRQVAAIGLVVTELVINACKHAFPDDRDGTIFVSFRSTGDGRHRLVVEDNGAGLPDGFDANGSGGLGMSLLQSFVRQLDGELGVSGGIGACFAITFPRDP